MPVIESTALDTASKSFAANRTQMEELLREVRAVEQAVVARAESARPKFEKRGQLLPRERIAALIDPGTEFFEFSKLASHRMHGDDGAKRATGGGNITGVGIISGREVVVVANDSAIKGGTITPMGLRKTLRAQTIALENGLPIVSLVESGGANLEYQADIFVEGGKVFRNMARLSAAGNVQITVVHGSSTAGGAYLPGLSDYVIMVKGRAKVFLAGPPLVKAALGEDAKEEELGGAKMHATTTGTAEYIAGDDAEALALARELVSKIKLGEPPLAAGSFEPPAFDIADLVGVIPADPRTPYKPREVIARLVDASDFLEFKRSYGRDTLCGHGAIEGIEVGFIANAAPIQPEGANKAAHFIQLCCQSGLPIVYLQNTTGFMVGTSAEQRGAVKHGAKLIQAVANASVPQLTIITGGGFGAGNYAMCGRAFEPRFLFAWPNARVAVMGGAQAAAVMETITRAKFEKLGQKVDDAALAQMREALRKSIDDQSSALFATARLWDDGIIDPRDTRKVLARCLRICTVERTRRRSNFGIPRF